LVIQIQQELFIYIEDLLILHILMEEEDGLYYQTLQILLKIKNKIL